MRVRLLVTNRQEIMDELPQFLEKSARVDVKVVALNHILGLTGSEDGLKALLENFAIIEKIFELVEDYEKQQETVAKDAALALINASGNLDIADKLIDSLPSAPATLWKCISDKNCAIADPCCMILSNLTIGKGCCDKVYESLRKADVTLENIVYVFCQEGYNAKGAKLHYIGPVLSNLSQLADVRKEIVDEGKCVVQRLLPFTEYAASKVRRGGIISTLRNCCLDADLHEFLLSDKVEILPRLLLPLAGPTPEDADPDEVEQLPMDLQYLDEDKKREEDPDLRKLLLESMLQLCAKKDNRIKVRDSNAYVILREYHKAEKDANVRLVCENLVDLLIKKEEEINVENYHEVKVPEDMVQELEDMDKEYLKE